MQIHTRQINRINAMNGARQAAEVNIRSLLPVEGQTVPEGILLSFFDRYLSLCAQKDIVT